MIRQWIVRKRSWLPFTFLAVMILSHVAAKAANEPSVALMSAGEIEDALHVSYFKLLNTWNWLNEY